MTCPIFPTWRYEWCHLLSFPSFWCGTATEPAVDALPLHSLSSLAKYVIHLQRLAQNDINFHGITAIFMSLTSY